MANTARDSTSAPRKAELETTLAVGHGEEKEERRPKIVPLHKLFSYADCTDKILMTIGTIGAIANGLSRPLMAVLMGEIIDDLGKLQRKDASSRSSEVPLKFVYLALGCGLGAFLQMTCWMITGERQGTRVRNIYLKALLRQEIAYFDKEVISGEVNGRMIGDTFLYQDAIGEKVGKFIQVFAGVIGGFMIAFVEGWLLALVLFSSYPIIFMLGKTMKFLQQKILLQSKIANDNATNLVQETIGSIRTVASFTGEKKAMANYKAFLTNSYKFDMCATLNIGLEAGLHSCLTYSNVSLGVWFGGILILHKDYTAGKVFTVFLAFVLGSGYNFLRLAYSSLVAFTVGQVAVYKMFQVINRKPIIDAYDTKGKCWDDIRGDIELRNVCFSYPSRPKELILDGFSLFIPNGTTTALVGHSGSGKSTIISLIERFYDPQSGEILIDGINIREFQVKWIRSKIGLVSQELVLFTSTIKDNIAYGKDGATLEEIRVAAELAKANDFINRLPQGLDTRVGEHGIQLSGGQKQRIAIARAILKNPRILLLDEATSALDTNSEKDVQESLDKLMVNRTTIIVAHRLSTIKTANMIAVIQKGRIVEKGTHLELLKDFEGIYSTLIASQEVDRDSEQIATKFERNSSQMTFSNHNLILESNEVRSSTSYSESMLKVNTTKANDKVETSPDTEASIFGLAHLNKPEFPVLIVATIFAIIIGAIPQTYAFVISNVIEAFYKLPHELKRDSRLGAFMILMLALLLLVSHPSKAYLFGVAGNKLIQRIRLMCFEKVINMEIGWFDEPQNSSAIISARLSNDATKIRILVGDALANYVQVASSLTVGLFVAFGGSWQLSLIVLALIPLIVFNMYVQMKSIKGFGNGAKVKYGEATQVSNDAIGNIRTIASFCAQEEIIKMHNQKCQAPIANQTKKGLICGTGFGTSVCFLYLTYAVIFYVGSKLVQDGKIRPADVFRVYYSLSMVSLAIYAYSSFAADSNEAKPAVTSIISILRRESKIDPCDESGMILENIDGEIELSHINFSYPSRPSDLILRDLSLTIHSGQVVAFVGESGSGKSTVISLIQRFYNPNSGQIMIDGIEIQKFQLKWLRQQIGVVSQEPILFNQTIRANIASGKEGSATEAEIISAARLANAHDFISSLQEGYDTVVGERGIQLSGGQKQRVAIARAIVKDPKILLLDEATSALDVESEKLVQEALDKVMKNKTTVIVAHRLSTIKGANIIAVFKHGRIMEKGNHDTLINIKHGLYSSLVGLQTTSLL